MNEKIGEFDAEKAEVKNGPSQKGKSESKKNAYLQKWATLLGSENANSGLILIGLPYSGKTTFANKIIATSKYEESRTVRISFLRTHNLKGDCDGQAIMKELAPENFDPEFNSESWKNTDVFIIEHLGYNIKSFDSNRIKLRLISYLISLEKRIILSSEMYPSQILDFYSDQKDENGQLSDELAGDYFSWRDILSAFPQVILGISNEHASLNTILQDLNELKIEGSKPQVVSVVMEEESEDEVSSSSFWERTHTFWIGGFKRIFGHDDSEGTLPILSKSDAVIGKEVSVNEESELIVLRKGASKIIYYVAHELGYGNFLPKLAPILIANCINDGIDEDDELEVMLDEQKFVMQAQSMSYGYYTDIWNSLPGRERYMLYDLAKDSFMNIKNTKALFNLIKKGLIIWQGRPVIFNRSFANFVASSGMEKEALSIEYKNRGQGSWSTMRMVIYLIILTIIVFIMMGKPGMMDDFKSFYGVLAGFGTIVPLLARFLFMGGNK